MTDTFAEQLVKRRQSSSDSIKKILLLAGGGVIIALLLLLSFMIPFLLILAAGVGYAIYVLLIRLNVEYEYTITNGTLDIDKIIAKRKRVSMISVNVKDFTAFGNYLSIDDDFSGTTVLTTGTNIENEEENEPYYADYQSTDYGEVRLIFSPSENILECIMPYLPRNLR